jgi:hypothetical protein
VQIVSERKEIIFKNRISYIDNNGNQATRVMYKIGLNHKNIDGTYTNGSMMVKFPNNTQELENKTYIYIENAWLDFYIKEKTKDNGESYKEVVPYIFINKFRTLEEAINDGKPDFDNMTTSNVETNNVSDVDSLFGNIGITEDDLPF